ncbi:MAG TPA: hypothetical protein VND22_07895 [Actinomycetota bacterium]|nr:hypothetical protein [Actinomycetota bacterium]
MPSRVVKFPPEKTIGKLKVRRRGFLDEWLGDARGAVEVPRGDLWLVAPKDQEFDLTTLDEINPNDLQALSLSEAKIDLTQIPRVAQLVGLQTLLLANTGITDPQVEQLRSLSNLRWLDISDNPIDGYSSAALADLPIEVLIASETKLKDEALEPLGLMKGIEILSLGFTEFGEVGMNAISSLRSLRSLSVPRTAITDEGLAAITKLSRIRRLNVSANDIGDKGLSYIAALPNLEALELGGTKITNEGLAHLRGAGSLLSLRVTKTALTDGAVPYLAQLKLLKYISIDGTGISVAGMERLKQMLPRAAVFR